jgi:hypothetical protein
MVQEVRDRWRRHSAGLRSTHRPTADLVALLDGAFGLGALVVLAGAFLGLGIIKLVELTAALTNLLVALVVALTFAPGVGFGMWGAVGAAVAGWR